MNAKTYISKLDDHPEIVVERIYSALEELNLGGDYNFAQKWNTSNEYETIVRIYSDVQPAQALEMRVDFEYSFVSLFHNSRDKKAYEALENELREKIGFETEDSLLRAVKRDLSARNIMRLMRGYKQDYNYKVGNVLERGLQASQSEVREATGLALIALKYQELKADLDAAIESETDKRALKSLMMARDALT